MAQAIILVEAAAVPPADWLPPRPDVVVVCESPEETPNEFATRVIRRIGAALSEGEVEESRYYAGPICGAVRFHVRCVIARMLLRAMGTGARSDLTFFAESPRRGQSLFALVDTLRSQQGGQFNVRLSFSGESASALPASGLATCWSAAEAASA